MTNDDRQTVTLQFSGDGYAWTPVTKRIGFSCTATVEYKPDFHKDGGTVYVWFRPANITAPAFQVGLVEQPAVGLATAMTPLGAFANLFGQQIVSWELGRGFTVIHESAATTSRSDLTPGVALHIPTTYTATSVTFMNEMAEVPATCSTFSDRSRSPPAACSYQDSKHGSRARRSGHDACRGRRLRRHTRVSAAYLSPPVRHRGRRDPSDVETDRSIALPKGILPRRRQLTLRG